MQLGRVGAQPHEVAQTVMARPDLTNWLRALLASQPLLMQQFEVCEVACLALSLSILSLSLSLPFSFSLSLSLSLSLFLFLFIFLSSRALNSLAQSRSTVQRDERLPRRRQHRPSWTCVL
jgi:hypothetical protein